MSSPIVNTAGISIDDLKIMIWIAGAFLSALVTGISAAWWFSQQLSLTRKDLYKKVSIVEKTIEDAQGIISSKIVDNKDDCRDTKERVTLLERDHQHQQEKTDKMDKSLMLIQNDLSETKSSVIELAQKSREDHLTLMGELRASESRYQLSMLEMKESLVDVVNQNKRRTDNE